MAQTYKGHGVSSLIVSATSLLIALAAFSTPARAQEGMPPPTVTVVTMQPQTLTLTSTLPGRVRASAQSEVRPQVNGVITKRLFSEGTAVEAGDLLYQIDPMTYEASVAQASASLSQAKAQLGAAQREYTRMQKLSERGVSSEQALDDALSSRDVAQAAVEVADAQLRSAQIQLERTEIRAELSGQIGLSEVSQGALVTASQTTPLATIRLLDPVHVDVTQSAADLLAWRRGSGATEPRADSAEVELTLADGSTYEHTGQLTAAEPHVDEQTGVIQLRMEFANPDEFLLPGMYVQVEMPTNTVEGVYLAPQEGVSRDRDGNPTAMIVNAEGVVEPRALTVLQDKGNMWVVSDGLAPGDRIIVEGLQKVAPGATVNAEERAAPAETQTDPSAAPAAAQD
ncbi:efflux RND transporter periplasmic adaptor subunit [Pseudooceanicola sp. HF7]|uniref:efflux RND transporter periplasmic adaptor subunit n=1 Tax=Pseudooceanicola sp. HF7 TaxID=2721560 RepID=UPI001431FDAD|nr:efflux RND transporter periplasmic adaptor subunit [Pseudooceanicola sp. HF7]NIZ10328.1 efflux RND transporter periplasmic adaptor subunit [Pseudooceanicola sp. HF7]